LNHAKGFGETVCVSSGVEQLLREVDKCDARGDCTHDFEARHVGTECGICSVAWPRVRFAVRVKGDWLTLISDRAVRQLERPPECAATLRCCKQAAYRVFLVQFGRVKSLRGRARRISSGLDTLRAAA
jgi:hypothetical protein